MVLVTPNTQALQGLCSEDRLDLLNVVDDLRAHGLSNYVSLPQIIVCGDQSSGKSSVLEAISGVSFPIQSGVCTRFPTELVLRKTDEPSVTVSIVPDPSHSEAEKESLLKFNNSLEGYEELPALINKAKLAMGILPHGKAFSKDILRVEVSGPDRPQLTIVDLPGLIHSPTKQQSATDVEVVKSLVDDYMKETRSIILAVVSAKYDYANQIVLKLSRATDESGERSLGVITKPDKLKPSSISENAFISLARNRDVYFHHGWHVLKNMDTEDGEASLPTRDAEEQNFFSRGVWRALPRIDLGIGHLRQRLSKLLLGQIVSELPSLIKEIETRSNECGQRLDQFGSPRITLEEQKSYLLRISQSFQSLVKAAVDGTYNDSFFGDAQLEIGYRKRMRAVAQNLNTTFETKIRIQGHLREIVRYVRESESTSQKPIPITRENFLEQVRRLLERTRGRELPGTFNPMVVKDLFSEQCVPWADIANQHIQSVWEAAKDFLELVITDVADETTAKAVLRNIFNPALDDIWSQLKDKTEDLLSWHQTGHPITYNHYFSETLQNIRSKRRREGYAKAVRGHFGRGSSGGFGIDSNVDIEALVDKLVSENEPDMDRFAASEALDCMKAYYKCAMKRFVDDIAVEVVEKTMIRKLESIFTPVSIFHLADKDVERIAGESEESRVQREELNQQLDILNKGSRVCKGYSAARSLDKAGFERGGLDQSSNEDSWTTKLDAKNEESPISRSASLSSSRGLVIDDEVVSVEADEVDFKPAVVAISEPPMAEKVKNSNATDDSWFSPGAFKKKGKDLEPELMEEPVSDLGAIPEPPGFDEAKEIDMADGSWGFSGVRNADDGVVFGSSLRKSKKGTKGIKKGIKKGKLSEPEPVEEY